MADEKIEVVCDLDCDNCELLNESEGECFFDYKIGNKMVMKGDVVTIEIKRKENIEAERKADIDAENKEYDDITRITRMENK